jgi:hypothetical protein
MSCVPHCRTHLHPGGQLYLLCSTLHGYRRDSAPGIAAHTCGLRATADWLLTVRVSSINRLHRSEERVDYSHLPQDT